MIHNFRHKTESTAWLIFRQVPAFSERRAVLSLLGYIGERPTLQESIKDEPYLQQRSKSECICSLFSLLWNRSSETRPPEVAYPLESFYKVAFGSAIFIYTVSLITILANSLLLLIFCVDPLKIFRNPTTYFLIGLAIVDLLTALVQEPIYATCFILLYIKHPSLHKCVPFMDFGGYFSAFSITVSLLIVFTVTQYIVISSPLKYGRLVTKKKVFISVVSIYLYTAIYCCLPLMGVPQNVKDAIELFLHNYAVVLVTIVFYFLLHYTMKKKMATCNTLQNESTSREDSKHTQVQRNFLRLNVILLIVLIVCFVPTMVIMTIRLFIKDYLPPILNANLMTDNPATLHEIPVRPVCLRVAHA